MKHFPELIRQLPVYAGRFEAFQLTASNCQVLFASYPAGTEIEQHTHETENVGVITEGELILITADGEQRYRPGDWYHIDAHQTHAARFDEQTSEVEFWFDPAKS